MKLPASLRNRQGSTLTMVLVMCAITLSILGTSLAWVTTNTTLSQRNNEYFRTASMAEAATEKVIARILSDYKRGGDSLAIGMIGSYVDLIPGAADNSVFQNYLFSDGQGGRNKMYVANTAPTEFRLLTSQYSGLRGYTTPFRIVSQAQQLNSTFQVPVALRQDIEVTTIPLFQFAIFYNIDMEINPGPNMNVMGRVHGNENIYIRPGSTLTFFEDVTAAGTIYDVQKPGDPSIRTGGTIVFKAHHDSGTSSLNLPIGTDNSPNAVHQVVEAPPTGESPTSALGSQRFYNKADMIITIPPGYVAGAGGNSSQAAGNKITITSGIVNNRGTAVPEQQFDIPQNAANGFLKDASFYNTREGKTVQALEIDVGKLKVWSSKATNVLRPTWAAGDVTVIYVDDRRTPSSTKQNGVRVVNGSALPSKGLTIATADPIYVKGDFNTTDGVGTSSGSSTTYTKPASLIGDAINILSGSWNDANSTLGLGSRVASDTTVNAAFLAGASETTPGSFGGGVENFPRFLEDWSGRTLTYNGSMVVMFPSRVAVGQWRGTGASIGIYNPPIRQWAFDANFRTVTKLPPSTPAARKIIRNVWRMVQPSTMVNTGS